MKRIRVKNITEHLYHWAHLSPGKLLLLHPVEITFKTFCKLVDSYAGGFKKRGISKGTRTIVLIKPGIDLFATIFALLRVGAVPVLIDPGMGNRAMAKALCGAGAEAFIGIPKALLLKYVFPKAFESVRIWISTGFCVVKNGHKLSALKDEGTGKNKAEEMNRGDEAAVFFTSGSTGPAKAVVYKHYMFEAQLELLKSHFKYHPHEIDLCTFPLIGLFSMCLGLSVVLADMDMTHPARLNPGKLVQNITKYQCTYLFCSPMVLKKLARYSTHHHIKLPSLKRIMTAGAPVSPELLQHFTPLISNDAELHTPYGATEALPVTDISHRELLHLYDNAEGNLKGLCVGYPLKNIDLRIITITDSAIEKWEEAKVCKVGEVGEIVVNGNNVSQHYLNNGAANKFSKIEDRDTAWLWHRTGDLGRLDERGRVWFYGRKSQSVKTDDRILFTVPTEAVFNRHEDVERSALVGVQKNNAPKAVLCIQLKSGRKRSKQLVTDLRKMAEENDLSKYISEFHFFKKFPVDPRHNAKIYREKLAQWIQEKVK